MEYDIRPEESVSTAVVRAVSAVEGREHDTLRPLTEILDPEALDDLFAQRADGTPRVGGRLTFVYSDCQVTVENGEYLTVRAFEPRGHTAPDGNPADRAR